MERKRTPFECSTGNCHAEIAPPVIFLDILPSCEHAVIIQNPLSSTQMSSVHQLPRYPLTKQVTILQSCHTRSHRRRGFSLGPPGAQLMPAERDWRKPCCSPVPAPVLEHLSQLQSKGLSMSKWGSYSWAPSVSHNVLPCWSSDTETQIRPLITAQQFKLK